MTVNRYLDYVASQFAREGMLVKVVGQFLIVDRLPMRSVKTAKNLRNRYQILSADQSFCKVVRSVKQAVKLATDYTENWVSFTLYGQSA